jgi:hypothetical protein
MKEHGLIPHNHSGVQGIAVGFEVEENRLGAGCLLNRRRMRTPEVAHDCVFSGAMERIAGSVPLDQPH